MQKIHFDRVKNWKILYINRKIKITLSFVYKKEYLIRIFAYTFELLNSTSVNQLKHNFLVSKISFIKILN